MWKFYSTSQKGCKPNHEICQDFYNEVNRGDVNCIAVCDGASSGVHSELGAEFISKFLSEYFAENFDIIWNNSTIENQSMIDDLHASALLKLSEFVVSKGYVSIVDADFMISKEELGKYCTTVQLIAVKNDQVIVYKIGNGSIAYIDGDKIKLLSKSEHGDLTPHFTYVNTIDTVINSQLRKYTITDNIGGFIIMSDGVDFEGGMYYNGRITDNIPILINKIRENEKPLDVLSACISDISKHQTNISNDDITISVLLRDSIDTVIKESEGTIDEFCNIITSLGTSNDDTIKSLMLDETAEESKKKLDSIALLLESQPSLIQKCCEKVDDLESKMTNEFKIETSLKLKIMLTIISILTGLSFLISAINLCLEVLGR